MKSKKRWAFGVALILILALSSAAPAWELTPRDCPPERCIPPETIGDAEVPFDVPIWPTIVKTEFHILPWVKWGKASVCIPGTRRALEFSCPSFSLKAIPVWIPWLRPLDVECKDEEVCVK
jgi:hypothetical protein